MTRPYSSDATRPFCIDCKHHRQVTVVHPVYSEGGWFSSPKVVSKKEVEEHQCLVVRSCVTGEVRPMPCPMMRGVAPGEGMCGQEAVFFERREA